jgi:hypothetical protein
MINGVESLQEQELAGGIEETELNMFNATLAAKDPK